MKKISRAALLIMATTSLTGCLVKPEPIDNKKHTERAISDIRALYNDVDPLDKPLTLPDAISRALMYNFDYKMGLMEQVLQNNQLTLANFNMLPRLAANAGYGWRSDERATRSISLLTRTESLEPSFSEERVGVDADLGFSWNLLDFGLSYYQAKQQADRVLSAVERRRRVMNNMVKEIQSSYWRALSAQQLLPEVQHLIVDVDEALQDAKEIERQKLQPAVEILEYRRSLMQIMFQLTQLQSELSIAKSELRSLINLEPGQEFILEPSKSPYHDLPYVKADLSELQNYSLVFRPELREETYQERIDQQNVKKEIIRLFPGLSVLGSTNYDSNRFLAFQNWQELGARATWNLINLVQGPKAIETAEAQVEISQMRRLALTAAVMSQVAISYNQYIQAVESYKMADEMYDIEAKVMEVTNNAQSANQGTRLARIQRKAMSIAAKLERNNTLVNAHVAHANLLVSVGVDLVPADHETEILEDLSAEVEYSLMYVSNNGLHNILKELAGKEAQRYLSMTEDKLFIGSDSEEF